MEIVFKIHATKKKLIFVVALQEEASRKGTFDQVNT